MEKVLLKYFLIFFVFFFLILNWGRISWIFNINVLSQFLSRPVKEREIKSPSHPEIEEGNKCQFSEKKESIEIPKIGVSAPLVLAGEEDNIHKLLDLGVVHFPDSAFPGEKGQSIILGHSAPPGWPKIKHDWVFSRIGDLQKGDLVILNLNGCRFKYQVSDKRIIKRGGEIPKEWMGLGEPTLVLLSCWPPGKDFRRMAILTKLLK